MDFAFPLDESGEADVLLNIRSDGVREMMTPLEKRIENLPPDEKKAVVEYMEELRAKRGGKGRTVIGAFSFKWAGVLGSLRERGSSVDVQHDALKWR